MKHLIRIVMAIGVVIQSIAAVSCLSNEVPAAEQTRPVAYDGSKGSSYNLVIAAYNGDLDKVRQLLKQGADPNARFNRSGKVFLNRFGGYPIGAENWTALIALSRGPYSSQRVPIAKLLLEHHADLKKDGGVALYWAAYRSVPRIVERATSIREISDEIAKELEAAGDDGLLSPSDEDGQPPEMTETKHWTELALLLIERGADVNTRMPILIDGPGWTTPLHYAVDQPELVRALIRAGAKVDAKDTAGRTPLDWAITSEAKEIVRLLRKATRRSEKRSR